MTKQERIAYGKEAEDFLVKTLREKGFEVTLLREVLGESKSVNLMDQVVGEILVKDVGTIDVKRGRGVITLDSAMNFKGDWFVIFPHKLSREACVLLPAPAVKSYIQKVKRSGNLKTLKRDGTQYYEFPAGTLNKTEVKLDDWIKDNQPRATAIG